MHLRFKMAVPPHPGAKPVPKQNEMRAGLNRQTIRSTRFGGNKKEQRQTNAQTAQKKPHDVGASSRSCNHAARKTNRLAKRLILVQKCRELAVQKILPTGLTTFSTEKRVVGVERFGRCVGKSQA